jgi:hypothetical protein
MELVFLAFHHYFGKQFWQTMCETDEALDNIRFSMDSIGIMQMVENWASK